jgi:hypothetical protein
VTTFAELGVPVPLFLAKVDFAEGFEDARACGLCGQVGPCLPLEDVLVACPACGDPTLVRHRTRVADRSDPCRHCQALVTVQGALAADVADAVRLGVPTKLRGCVPCLRSGRWAQTHATERGPVGWEPQVPDWQAELVATPRHATFQGEVWLFCHDLPMVYLGEWGQDDFEDARPGAGDELFAEIIEGVDEAYVEDAWESGLGPTAEESDLRAYVFRCQQCADLRARGDTD